MRASRVSRSQRKAIESPPDGKLRVWDVESGSSRSAGECYGVNAIAFTTVLVTGSEDGTVRLWDTDRF